MAFEVIGGLGIFLIGMRNMSDGMQAVAGRRMRRMINAVTDNRLMATGVGTAVTCLVQSSTITTVIVVGLVNSGLMMLHQAIGVIMGANIGTTITGWILVLEIGKYGLPILGVSVFVYLFSKQDRWRYIAMVMMGLGMIFFGLELMKTGFKPVREIPLFNDALLWFQADDFLGVVKCVLVGSILTGIVQSSSATLAITIAIATQGGLDFQTATALVLGQNIGTTVTAYLASIGTTTTAKRAAYFHILFNVTGVLILIIVFRGYLAMISTIAYALRGFDPRAPVFAESDPSFATNIAFAIASAHTVFNVLITVLMLPLARRWAALLERMVPDRTGKETHHLASFDLRMIESPMIGIEASRGEILNMGRGVAKMMDWTKQILSEDHPNEKTVQKVFHRETIMDTVQQEVIQFMTGLLRGEVPHSVTAEGRQHLRVADEYESISDYVSAVLKAALRLEQAELFLSPQERQQILELHDEVAAYVQMVTAAFETGDAGVHTRAETLSGAITHRVRELRENHMHRLSDEKIAPVASMVYTTMLNAYRKIKDHALNIAEAVPAAR